MTNYLNKEIDEVNNLENRVVDSIEETKRRNLEVRVFFYLRFFKYILKNYNKKLSNYAQKILGMNREDILKQRYQAREKIQTQFKNMVIFIFFFYKVLKVGRRSKKSLKIKFFRKKY